MNEKAITLKTLLEELQQQGDAALVFCAGDQSIRPRYHVTEIKCAEVQSIDCGRGAEQWTEVTVQLLDGPAAAGGEYMTAAKFSGIATAAGKLSPVTEEHRLFFEFAPGNGPLRKYRATKLERDVGRAVVQLSAETAVCKPLARLPSVRSGCC